jgi:hypothetical protein
MEVVNEFIAGVPAGRQEAVRTLANLIMEIAPELEPHLREGKLGFGVYQYSYKSGRTGEWFRVGIGNNKGNLALYFPDSNETGHIAPNYADQLPNAKVGHSCITFRQLADLDLDVVRTMVQHVVDIYHGKI